MNQNFININSLEDDIEDDIPQVPQVPQLPYDPMDINYYYKFPENHKLKIYGRGINCYTENEYVIDDLYFDPPKKIRRPRKTELEQCAINFSAIACNEKHKKEIEKIRKEVKEQIDRDFEMYGFDPNN